DSWYSIGDVGIRASAGVTFDNFAANNVAPIAASVPFSDNFAAGGTANQLNSNWEDRSGNFFVQNPGPNGVAQGTATSGNVSVLRFVFVGDPLRLFLDTTLLTFATDTVLTEGTVGIRGSATTVDNFSAVPAFVTQTSLPFADNLITTGDIFGQLSANWLIRQG